MHLNEAHDPARKSWVESANRTGCVPIGFGEATGVVRPAPAL